MNPHPNLFGLDRAELQVALAPLKLSRFRIDQIYRWLYAKKARSFAEMTNLSHELRVDLESRFEICWPELTERRTSHDGTIKYLLGLEGGATIESVYIPQNRRRTICISTQAGCPLRCGFCLTGIAGYKRNLSAAEILGQAALVMIDAADAVNDAGRPWNIVFMGMGEPLLNYDATVRSLRILMDTKAFAISPKKLTLSTVGILPALEKLMLEPVRPNLAISLHAPSSELRGELMPIEEKYAMEDVIAAAQRYPIPRGGWVTYEYVLLRGVNDSVAHARELARLLKGSRCKVNLIPLNSAPEIPFDAPRIEDVEAFARVLADAKVMASVRRARGQDILAACGQLHLNASSAASIA